MSVPTWYEEFELLDGLYSLSNIQDYFEYIINSFMRNVVKRPNIAMLTPQDF